MIAPKGPKPKPTLPPTTASRPADTGTPGTRFERWINGDRNRRLFVTEEEGFVILGDETVTADGDIYRRDRVILNVEESLWLEWALGELDRGRIGR